MDILITIPAWLIFYLSLIATIGTIAIVVKTKSYLTLSRVLPLALLSILYSIIWFSSELSIELARMLARWWMVLFLITEVLNIVIYFSGQYIILNGNNKKWNHKY